MKAERILLEKGLLTIAETPEAFPLGQRGKRPIRFTWDSFEVVQNIRELRIPGVITRGNRIDCAWDVAPVIAELLGPDVVQAVEAALNRRLSCPLPNRGTERYKLLGLDKARRAYQADGIRYLLRRSYAILGDIPRAGKTLMLIGTAEMAGAERILIVCPALSKYVWADEIAKWSKQESAILFGKAGDEVRIFCTTCHGSGELIQQDGSYQQALPCPDCRARNGQALGERIFQVRDLVATEDTYNVREATGKRNRKGEGTFRTKKIRFCPLPPVFKCTAHPDNTSSRPGSCETCKKGFLDRLRSSRWVIVNYDILGAHKDKTDAGVSYFRSDLPGWGPVLAQLHFDVAFLDESHLVSGWESSAERKQKHRRELVCDVVDPIDRVYAATGTPMRGFVRDLWGQLDCISRGLWS